jgi:hypothetical protein
MLKAVIQNLCDNQQALTRIDRPDGFLSRAYIGLRPTKKKKNLVSVSYCEA